MDLASESLCVLARGEKWIRDVCIAAALILPAVAAVHGIVLAALHVNDAADMDIYGALQFCSIGILAVPLTVKKSETYFHEKGRNTVFVWTSLLLAGLVSLAVEFYRSNSIPCYQDNNGNPISSDPRKFPYGDSPLCGITCSQTDGPFSRLRQKAASEIFVVPRPNELRFGNAMFLAVACCVPAIISLISMRNKIVITDWIKRQNGPQKEKGNESDESKDLHGTFSGFLNLIEIFVFGGAALAILILGEINLWSPQMDYHTEPFGSVGQWGTIVATGLAIVGSFLIYLLDGINEAPKDPLSICGCEHCRLIYDRAREVDSESFQESEDGHADHIEHGLPPLTSTSTRGTQATKQGPGHRRKVSAGLVKVGKWFGSTTEDPFGAPDYRERQWPEVPGERFRSSALKDTAEQYSTYREHEPQEPVSPGHHSGSEGGPATPRPISPISQESPLSPPPPSRARPRNNSEPVYSRSPSRRRPGSPSSPAGSPEGPRTRRRQTLEVPGQRHFAEVIKVEHPVRGDDTRAWGPPYATYKAGSSKEGPGESAYFLAVNRNKKSLGLNFQHPSGTEILHKLVSQCDILVENYLPGTLKKYKMDYDTLRAINPGLIYASITGYGQTGPYSDRAGYDVMVEAEFGLMHITGSRDGEPVKVGVAVTDLTTGLYTSNSIMAALLARGRTGRGQHIDVALSDCQTATLANIASSCLISGKKDSGRWGTAHPSIVPYKSFKTKDGDILFGGGNDRLYGILCQGLNKPEWQHDAKYATNAQRVANRVELEALIEQVTVTKTTAEWLRVFEGHAGARAYEGAEHGCRDGARGVRADSDGEYAGQVFGERAEREECAADVGAAY
ncbi:CoA-transferase family III [Colletotrichum cuscutae]|uniref:CoA-transferase family III n=1 Tax=Colletotrichum cuscutae TaxID=1209917 RepID=A0AAI9Y4Z6_9PEZI|nr:CoA-transferase family III [Colletotrichum cuscutae]